METDECNLEAISSGHAVAMAPFVPFAIARLRGDTEVSEKLLTVKLRAIAGSQEAERKLRLYWSAVPGVSAAFGVQDNTVTEWAAIGVAGAIITQFAGLRIRAVTEPGDRFDFWVTDGKQQYGLEVSGTITSEVEARHREKVRQLRSNPHRVDGYVVVVGFATDTVIFSFQHFEEK